MRLYFFLIANLFKEFLRVCLPLFITSLLKYFEGRSSFEDALQNGLFICICIHINNTIIHPHYLTLTRIGLKMRIALSGLIYKKSLTLNLAGLDNQASGKLINILSNDCSRVENSVYLLSYLIIAPLEAAAVIVLLVYLIDLSVLYGLVVVLIAIPIQAGLGKLFDHLRLRFFLNVKLSVGI